MGESCCGGKNGQGHASGATAHDHHHDEHAEQESAGGCCGGKGGGSGECCGGASKSQKVLIPTGTREEIAAIPSLQMLIRFRRGIGNIDSRVFGLSLEQLDMAFLPDAGVGRWSCRVLLGHLADAELAILHRVRRAIAEENPVVALWDENAFVDSGLYGLPSQPTGGDPASVIGGYVAVIHTLRMWAFQWLAELSDAQWERKLMHPLRGPVTVREMVAGDIWHLEHHCRFLQQKLDRMLGPVIEEPAVAGGCGCKHG